LASAGACFPYKESPPDEANRRLLRVCKRQGRASTSHPHTSRAPPAVRGIPEGPPKECRPGAVSWRSGTTFDGEHPRADVSSLRTGRRSHKAQADHTQHASRQSYSEQERTCARSKTYLATSTWIQPSVTRASPPTNYVGPSNDWRGPTQTESCSFTRSQQPHVSPRHCEL
jgi:hypothetical protein